MNESLTSELWLKIDQSHLKYLQSEDTPLKLEIRKKLEGIKKKTTLVMIKFNTIKTAISTLGRENSLKHPYISHIVLIQYQVITYPERRSYARACKLARFFLSRK